MATTDRDLLITPNKASASNDPKIEFKSGGTSGDPITLSVTDDGTTTTLDFSGSAGQLFSIANDLTGTIFAAADGSGVPIIEADADGTVRLAPFGGTVEAGAPFREKIITSSGTTAALDLSAGSVFWHTAGAGTTTFTFSNGPASGYSQTITVIHQQDGTGSRAASWPAALYWAENVEPPESTGASDIDVYTISIINNSGVTYYWGALSLRNAS
jgi:hypothetical protein